MRKGWSITIIAVLAVANIALIVQLKHARESAVAVIAPADTYVGAIRLPDMTVVDRDGDSVSLREIAARHGHTMFVFFAPSDCPPCFSESELWNEVVRRGDAAVYGVGTHTNAPEFFQWVDNTEWGIQAYLDTTGWLEREMNFRVTPLKVLVDSTARIQWADPPRSPGEERERFWRDLGYAVANL
ncbi:MAG: redoxin family protein [candidate division Zixibacteria bacterium]|jgi:hypothetical protein|nr:redoxin family protein [candidate division Zixibacteria bacterium]